MKRFAQGRDLEGGCKDNFAGFVGIITPIKVRPGRFRSHMKTALMAYSRNNLLKKALDIGRYSKYKTPFARR